MAQDLDLESIHGAWVQQLISEAATWNTVLLTPNSMFDVLEKCSPSTSLVFTLQPGEYVFRKPLTIHRAAPCIIRAQGSSTVRFVNAPKDELNKNDSSVKQGLQAGGMVRVHGSGNVVFEGITFEARNGHRDFEACIAIRSDGFVCLSDCHFASACSSSNRNEPVTVDEINREVTGGGECSCVEISQTRGVFFTQCEFLAGDAGIACQVTSSASSSRGLEPPVIAVEDCGFSSSRKFQPDDATLENVVSHRLVGELRCGIRLRKPRLSDSQAIADGSSSQGKAKGKKNTEENSKAKATSSSTLSAIPYILRVDHSSFESIEGPFIETCAAAVVSAAVTVEHCTVTHCGDELLPAALMRGHCSLHMHDCSMSSCGVVVLAHHSTTTMKECTISSPIPSSSESSSAPVRVLDTTLVPYHRQIVVQDKANVVVQRCEWIGNANASPRDEIAPSGNEASTNEPVCGAQFAFMSLLSSGRVAIEGSVFRFGLNNNGDDLDLVENSVASLSAASTTVAILVDGSCAPHISGNKFHSDLHLSHGSKQRGVLLGLWHDAQMQDNEFSGTFATEESYCGLEEFPQSMILAQPHGSAAMGNELEEDSVASSSEQQHHQQQQQQQPKIPSTNTSMDDENAAALPAATTAAVPVQNKHTEEDRKEVEHIIPADDPETDDDDDDHDNLVQHNDQKDVDRDNASSTIAKLRAQVKALKGQLKKQQHTTTMTDTKVKPPSRPSSAKPARPASAKSSRSSRPTSASVTRPSTAATTRENIDNNNKDDHLVRIGHHKWNMTLMKPFMQGLVPLSQVRRVATPDMPNADGTNQNSPKRTISPSAIYDNWKRAQTDKRDAEKMLLNRAKAEEMAKQRRLTPRQQQESVARLHTESVEHNKEVRERCIAEETSRFQPHQPITNKTNDAVLELAGDFQDRLSKDLRDRELRRENLLKKYIPEQARTRRSQSEIVAYASSLHKAHHDASLVARAEAEAGVTIRVAPPRSAYPKQRPHRKVLKADELIDYCTSLYHSHKEERLAERAAAIAGEEAVARVASRSSSRR